MAIYGSRSPSAQLACHECSALRKGGVLWSGLAVTCDLLPWGGCQRAKTEMGGIGSGAGGGGVGTQQSAVWCAAISKQEEDTLSTLPLNMIKVITWYMLRVIKVIISLIYSLIHGVSAKWMAGLSLGGEV